jgi:membrane dipeptidase
LVISHTAARALTDHPRNTGDETIRAVANKGGVVGVYFMPFLTLDSQPKGDDLIRHIEHIANVAGEDHVGIGTDNGVLPRVITEATRKANREWALGRIKAGIASPGEGPDVFPIVADYNSIDRYRRLADDLGRRGWSASRLEKLLGGNFLRVYRDAWGA